MVGPTNSVLLSHSLAPDSIIMVVACTGAFRVQSAALADVLELTDENVEMVLDEIRPYLMAGDALPHVVWLQTLSALLKLAQPCRSAGISWHRSH